MAQNTKESLLLGLSKAKENLFGLIKAIIRDNLLIMIYMDMESTIGLTEGIIKDIGMLIKCMAMVFLLEQMEKSMTEDILMIKKKDGEYFHGLMGKDTKEIGSMDYNMGKGRSMQEIK